ncbi:EH_Signature domain-containing protein [Variovorax sp. CF079]|nr:EH_Signature domain-containing protein [Variovorax sp. CF079]
MTRLESAVGALGESTAQAPPPIAEIGKRLRHTFASHRATGYAGLSRADQRKLPYAYWIAGEPALPEIDPALVTLYWETLLPDALQGSSKRAKRWLAPLFFVYCESFDANDPRFMDFASRLVHALEAAPGPFGVRLRAAHGAHEFFAPHEAPKRLAALFLSDQSQCIELHMADLLLWPGFLDTRMGTAIFASCLALPDDVLREKEPVSRLLAWSKKLAAPISQTGLRAPFAEALLKPWSRRKPPDDMKTMLLAFFIPTYGDPRITRIRWEGVPAPALAALLNWLTGDTLRGFMKLLQRTADEIWMYRQKFWMAYYDAGYIDEAWLALGPAAREQARRLQVDEKGMGYSRLEGNVSHAQSVLLLKVGDLIFTEWSHNGSLRAYRDTDLLAPKLYQPYYYGEDLRAVLSMDFHGGFNANPELRHMNSEGGTWQRKARDLIRHHTGVYLRDAQIYET